MTDRINAITLVLDRDIRDDDVESLRQACLHLRFVQSATLNVCNIDAHVGEQRAKNHARMKLYALLKDYDNGSA